MIPARDPKQRKLLNLAVCYAGEKKDGRFALHLGAWGTAGMTAYGIGGAWTFILRARPANSVRRPHGRLSCLPSDEDDAVVTKVKLQGSAETTVFTNSLTDSFCRCF